MVSNRKIVHNTVGKTQVWKHFGFFAEEDGIPVRDKADCWICFNKISYCKIATNLHVHLERHHRSEYTLLLKAGDKDKFAEESTQPTIQRFLNEAIHYQKIVNGGKNWLTLWEILSHLICSCCQLWKTKDSSNY